MKNKSKSITSPATQSLKNIKKPSKTGNFQSKNKNGKSHKTSNDATDKKKTFFINQLIGENNIPHKGMKPISNTNIRRGRAAAEEATAEGTAAEGATAEGAAAEGAAAEVAAAEGAAAEVAAAEVAAAEEAAAEEAAAEEAAAEGAAAEEGAAGEGRTTTTKNPSATKIARKVRPSGDHNNPPPNEKPNWLQFKKDKKELKVKRKSSKDQHLFQLNIEAKRLYEQLKCKKVTDRNEIAINLYQLLQRAKCIQKFVLAHDTSRIVQCLTKYLPMNLREELTKELLPISIQMITSKYAHFCICRILKYGNSNMKTLIINSLMGSIIKLVTNHYSSRIIDHIYFQIATKKQKIHMRQEFYSDLYLKQKDDTIKHLNCVLKNSLISQSDCLNGIKLKLEHIANKKMAENSLVHSVLLEYINYYTNNNENNQISDDCLEIIRMYSSLIPNLVTTRNGCLAAIWCFWLSTTKERRAILKSLKEHLEKIFLHEHGHLFITAIINTMDDTKAIVKVLFEPILTKLDMMIENRWARKLIQWFVSPSDTQVFHPQLIKYLDIGLKYSKKEKPLRVQEIFQQIENPICDLLCENPNLWLLNGHIGLLTSTVIKRISGENCRRVFEALTKIICQLDWKIHDKTLPIPTQIQGIEDSGMHIVIKKMLKNDEIRIQNNELTLSGVLTANLNENLLLNWIQFNRGCYILLNIYEKGTEMVQKDLKKMLVNVAAQLKTQESLGARMLVDKLGL